jgi:hypothetical protein
MMGGGIEVYVYVVSVCMMRQSCMPAAVRE